MSKRQYSDNDKATALAVLDANQGNVKGTARQLSIPHKTLDEWAKGRNQHPEVAVLRTDKKQELHGLFEQVARLYLGQAMEEATIKKTSGKDSVIAAATATDKMRLLTEQATSISKDVTEHSHEERANRILELVKPARTG
jgi:transposase-like protein